MSIYLENASRLNITTSDPKAEKVIDMLIEHMKLQDARIAGLKHYGFYQLCPKCDGEKIIPGTHYDNGTVLVDRTCPLCKGEGKLVRPEIKTT